LSTGRVDEAVAVYDEILSFGPDFDDKILPELANAAQAYEKAGALDKAISVWDRILKRDSRRADYAARRDALKRKKSGLSGGA
jgi:tetratricopeptide (TPR) repeat protein